MKKLRRTDVGGVRTSESSGGGLIIANGPNVDVANVGYQPARVGNTSVALRTLEDLTD
jgi:hypothetical protein